MSLIFIFINRMLCMNISIAEGGKGGEERRERKIGRGKGENLEIWRKKWISCEITVLRDIVGRGVF